VNVANCSHWQLHDLKDIILPHDFLELDPIADLQSTFIGAFLSQKNCVHKFEAQCKHLFD
jgi:hypothetical protein